MISRAKKNSCFYKSMGLLCVLLLSSFLFVSSISAMGHSRDRAMPLVHRAPVEVDELAKYSKTGLYFKNSIEPLNRKLFVFIRDSGACQLIATYTAALTAKEQKKVQRQLEEAVVVDENMLAVESALRNGAYVSVDKASNLLRWSLVPTSKQKFHPNMARLFLAEGGKLPSAQEFLRLTKKVESIDFLLKNGEKLNKEQLGSLLVYAVENSTAPMINLLIEARADIYTARSEDPQRENVIAALWSRIKEVRSCNGKGVEELLEALEAVVEAGGFDHVSADLEGCSEPTHSIISIIKKCDARVGLYVSEIFNRSKSDLQDKYGKFAEELIKGYAASGYAASGYAASRPEKMGTQKYGPLLLK